MDLLNVRFDAELGARLLRTAGLVGGAYLLGHLANVIIVGRIVRFASRTSGAWDDILVDEIKKRIPFWSVLAGLAASLGQWTLSPHGLLIATSGIKFLGIVSATMTLSAIASRMLVAYGPLAIDGAPVSALAVNVSRGIIFLLGSLVIADDLGINISPWLAALGVGGLAVALALQDPLSNLFSGLSQTLSGQIRIGDFIRLESGFEGHVVDFDWRSTRIKMLSNNLVIVPNAKLAQATIVNFSKPSKDFGFSVEVGVAYASDLVRVEEVTLEVAREVLRDVQGGMLDAEPSIRFHTFADSSVRFNVNLRGKEYADQFLLKHEFMKRLLACYRREGIVMPYPQRTVSLDDSARGLFSHGA